MPIQSVKRPLRDKEGFSLPWAARKQKFEERKVKIFQLVLAVKRLGKDDNLQFCYSVPVDKICSEYSNQCRIQSRMRCFGKEDAEHDM